MGSKSAGRSSSKGASKALTPQAALDRIVESKRAIRRKLAQLPFEEKFRMVLEMRRLSQAAIQKEQDGLGYRAVAYFAACGMFSPLYSSGGRMLGGPP